MVRTSKYTAPPDPRPLGLLGLTLAVSLGPALWMLLVPPGTSSGWPGESLVLELSQGLLAWWAAGTCLFAAILAWSLREITHGRLLRGTAAGLVVGAAAEGVLAMMLFASTSANEAPIPPATLEEVWLLARLGCILAPLAAGWVLVRHDPPTWRRSAITALVVSALGVGTLLWAMLDESRTGLAPRPWELVLLIPLAATWWTVTRPLLRHRSRPFLLSLEFSLIPQGMAQIHAALSPLDGDGQNAAALLRLVALLILLLGMTLDQRRIQAGRRELEVLRRSLERQQTDLDSSQRRLSGEIQVRKEMEAGLRMLRKAVETTQLGITLTDTDGKILYANPAQARMYGCRPGELIGQPASIFGPEDRRRPISEKLLGTLSGLQREGVNLRHDGSRFPVRLSSDAVRDTGGQVVGIVTICEDITDRKRVERELERRGAALEAVSFSAEWFLRNRDWQESLDQLLAELGSALDVSRIFVLESQRQEGELVAMKALQEWTREERVFPLGEEISIRGNNLEALRRVLRAGQAWTGDTRALPREFMEGLFGSRFAHLLLCPVTAGDVPWGVIGLSEERVERQWTVSEMESLSTAARILGAALARQRHEEALRQSEERFRDLFENASDLIQSVDLNGRFQYVNRAWLRTLGYTIKELEDLTFQDIVAPEHLPHCMEVFQRVLQGETVDSIETVFLTRRGERVFVEGSTSCYYRDGEPAATRGIFHNITERREVDRLKSDFIAMVSHELRTPLTSIYASLQLLAGGTMGELPQQIRQLVEIADKNSRRLVRLVEDIIDVERIESGHIPFRWQVVHLRNIVEQALEANDAYARRFGVSLALVDGEDNPPVRVDTDRLMQVLTNLISNAVKFSPHGGQVELEVRADGKLARAEIRDHGPGVPEEFREKIFQRFVQVDSVHTRSKEGSGLGLSIARSIVQRLEGKIDFHSRPGEGAVFFFEIPIWNQTETRRDSGSLRRDAVLRPMASRTPRSSSDA